MTHPVKGDSMLDVLMVGVALFGMCAPFIGIGLCVWFESEKNKSRQNNVETENQPRTFVPMASPADLMTGAASSPTLSCRAQPTSNAQATYSGLNALDKLLD